MTSQIKIWGPEEDLLNTDLNTEFAHVYATILAQSVGAASSVTPDLLSDGANPEVFFAELFEDGRVLGAGLAFTSSSGLNVTLSDGTAYILKTSTTPAKLVRVNQSSFTIHAMSPSTTNFIDLNSDGIFTVTTASVPAADSTRLLEVVTDVTSVTANTDKADRVFPENITLTPFSRANLVVEVITATTATLKSGAIFRDSANTKTITTTTDLTATITTSGLNGLDQGSESSNTWYAFLEIEDAIGSLPKATLLVSETNYPSSIVFPAGYSLQRRVAWVRNNGSSNFNLGIQADDIFTYDDEQTLASAFSQANFTNVATSSFTSPSSRMFNMSVVSTDTSAGNTEFLFVTRGGITSGTGGIEAFRSRTGNPGSPGDANASILNAIPVDGTSSRNFAARTSGAIDDIFALGYFDLLGD